MRAYKTVFLAICASVLMVTQGCGGGGGDGVSTTTVTGIEQAKTVAVANVAPFVQLADPVYLDGSKSTFAPGGSNTYLWVINNLPSGSHATIANSGSSSTRLLVDVAGTYMVSLTVSDGKTTSTQSGLRIVVNGPPVANVGSNQSVLPGATVALDGSASSDPNLDALTYTWTLDTKPVGSVASLSNLTTAKPSFVADKVGTYVASLVVRDGTVNSEKVSVTVTASPIGLQLFEITSPGFFAGYETFTPFPYSGTSVQNSASICLGGCPTTQTLASFRVVAFGGDFTIANLTATDANGVVVPSFVGLTQGQTIASGQSVTFKLTSPMTGGRTANLNFAFTVGQTGQTFRYQVQLQTN